jgi:hypothetical protein
MEGKREQHEDPDAGVVDDKTAEACERAGRIEKDARTPSNRAQDAAVDTEGRQRERDAVRSESGKSRGNGDDAIEDASLSGRPPADNEDF